MKFEMNRWTLEKIERINKWYVYHSPLKTHGILVSCGLGAQQYKLLGHLVMVNTNKPDGIVQFGRNTTDLSRENMTYSQVKGSLESLLVAARSRNEGGRINFGPGGSYSIPVTKEEDEGVTILTEGFESPEGLYVQDVSQDALDNLRSAFENRAKGPGGNLKDTSSCDSHRASGRTFRSLLDVMKTASESEPGSLTLFISLNETCQRREYYMLVATLQNILTGVFFRRDTLTAVLPDNRTIKVVTKEQIERMTFDEGKRINVVYDHTVQGN